MLKKTMTYEGVDGNPVTDDFYFHLSKAEIFEFEVSEGSEGVTGIIAKMTETSDPKKILELFKRLVGASVGKKSEDGKYFEKTDAIRNAFMQSEAYSDLFISMLEDPQNMVDFCNGLLPSGTEKITIQDLDVEAGARAVETVQDGRPLYQQENREPTNAELQAMSKEEMAAAFAYKARLTPDAV